jgi:hypothetical protein
VNAESPAPEPVIGGRSLFAPWQWSGTDSDRQAYLDVIKALSYLAPDPLYGMLWTLRLREAEATMPGVRAGLESDVRRAIGALPGLASVLDAEAVAAASARYQLGRDADYVYHAACKSVPGLLDKVVTFEGGDRLERAARQGPVILAAYHFGPSDLLVGGIARRFAPLTVVVSDPRQRPDSHGLREGMRCFTEVDIQLLANNSAGVLLGALRALRMGRPVVIFPELSFRDAAGGGAVVMFGGRAICVPEGIAGLAAKTGATVLPCHVERPEPGFFRCVIGEPLPTGPELTERMFAHCEALIRGGLAADWVFWPYVMRNLFRMPQAWPRLSALDPRAATS